MQKTKPRWSTYNYYRSQSQNEQPPWRNSSLPPSKKRAAEDEEDSYVATESDLKSTLSCLYRMKNSLGGRTDAAAKLQMSSLDSEIKDVQRQIDDMQPLHEKLSKLVIASKKAKSALDSAQMEFDKAEERLEMAQGASDDANAELEILKKRMQMEEDLSTSDDQLSQLQNVMDTLPGPLSSLGQCFMRLAKSNIQKEDELDDSTSDLIAQLTAQLSPMMPSPSYSPQSAADSIPISTPPRKWTRKLPSLPAFPRSKASDVDYPEIVRTRMKGKSPPASNVKVAKVRSNMMKRSNSSTPLLPPVSEKSEKGDEMEADEL